VADVVHVSIAPTPSLLHHNNVGVIYPRTSNLRMEPMKSIPLYFIVMPQSMVTINETPFTIAPTHIIVSLRSIPQIPRETQLVSVHIKMPKKVDMIFFGQPLDPKVGSSNPLRPAKPLGYFGLLMMNLGKPPLPPNMPIVSHLTILSM
jgi:hypothetical protein